MLRFSICDFDMVNRMASLLGRFHKNSEQNHNIANPKRLNVHGTNTGRKTSKERSHIESFLKTVRSMSATSSKRQEFCFPLERTRFLRRRNNYDIFAEILAACKKQPRTQSWLLSHLRLSTNSAKNYLEFLLTARLIDANKTQGHRTTTYATTANGKKALDNYLILTTHYFSI